jgi:hypothetical protein
MIHGFATGPRGAQHGFGQSRSYALIWDKRHYPHKAILGTAYEFAAGLAPRPR